MKAYTADDSRKIFLGKYQSIRVYLVWKRADSHRQPDEFLFFITDMIIKSQVFYMIQIAMKSLQLTLISPLPGTDYSGHATHINSDHGGQGFL